MGGGASVAQQEAARPGDGSDITTAKGYVQEVQRLRSMIRSINDLPPGWVAYEQEDGNMYYYHEDSGAVQWQHPSEETVASAASGPFRKLAPTLAYSLLLQHQMYPMLP